MREPEDVLLADLRRIAVTVDPMPHVVIAPRPWSGAATDPLADMRAMAARLEALPFRRVKPLVVSPRHHALYQQALTRLDAQAKLDRFHRDIAWRRLRAKRLTPMYAAYRHRARRRSPR